MNLVKGLLNKGLQLLHRENSSLHGLLHCLCALLDRSTRWKIHQLEHARDEFFIYIRHLARLVAHYPLNCFDHFPVVSLLIDFKVLRVNLTKITHITMHHGVLGFWGFGVLGVFVFYS